jgi:hypothetical protein
MEATTTTTNVFPIEQTWTDPETGTLWLIFSYQGDHYYLLKTFPRALRHDGKIFARMGWNSDTCKVHYRETNNYATDS